MPPALESQLAKTLLARWDAQQERYIARREDRFDIIIEAVRLQCGDAPTVIDLAGGPGSLGRRLLTALPGATVWSVDADPLLQTIGATAYDGLRWVEVDLSKPGWSGFLKGSAVDAVVSTTALHWLRPEALISVYHELAAVMRPQGIFLDGDHCPWPKGAPTLGRLADDLTRSMIARNSPEAEDWPSWWASVSTIPALQDAFRRREAFYADRPTEHPVTVAFHVEALLTAGFAEAGPLWQIATDWIVAGIR